MPALRVAIAEDEPLARERLARLLEACGCDVAAEFGEAKSLLAWMREGHKVDGLFLDVQMPGITGLEAAAELKAGPPIVFVTAHAQHALQAFDVAAVDFLLKPVFQERLERSLERLNPHLQTSVEPAKPVSAATRVAVKAGDGHLFLDLKKISHFELEDGVVWAWSVGERFRTNWTTLVEVESSYPEAGLVRIHRHLLLRSQAVLGMRPLWGGRALVRVADGVELEVSRYAAPKLREVLGLGR